jgi:malonate decarboxylase beta subunit
MMTAKHHSFFEATARFRISLLADPDSFVEFCPPELRHTSPHLEKLDLPVSFDDGAIVGKALMSGFRVMIAAQEGKFMGGSVGEVHGAKIHGLLEKAGDERPNAVVLLIDSGGVRLQEANAGLIAISEIMRALLKLQASGIPVFALIGGTRGAFGGMGIVARLCDEVIMSEQGRLGLSGPEVIETMKGVEEFDASDRGLVWSVTGGKERRTLGEATRLVDDDISAFRRVVLELLAEYSADPILKELQSAHRRLTERVERFAAARDGRDVFIASRFKDVHNIALLTVDEFNRHLGEEV